MSKPLRREALSALVGLAALLHDIHERASEAFFEKALRSNRNTALTSALRAIRSYSNSNFRVSDFDGVRIFEEAALDEGHSATTHVKTWLRSVPASDLQGISRIYIVRTKPEFDYLGTYLPMLHVVTLVWQTPFPPRQWLNLLLNVIHKHTLYHEIGHHAHKHTEFGQDPDQEDQAVSYAGKLVARTHPLISVFARLARPFVRYCDRSARRRRDSSAR